MIKVLSENQDEMIGYQQDVIQCLMSMIKNTFLLG